MIFTFQFASALILDALLGDPRSLPHPVRFIGWLCTFFERNSRKIFNNVLTAGAVSFLGVLTTTILFLYILLALLHVISPVAEAVVAVILLYTSIACRDLSKHSMAVFEALQNGAGIEAARHEIAKIVGRDTSSLNANGICRACVETIAENLVDGVTAPIFFAVLLSMVPAGELLAPVSMAVLGVYGYKAINTMDSMYGYKNEQYLYFGRFAAKIDDLVNLLPARLSGLFLIAAAWILRLDARSAAKIFIRDRLCHASPNAAHPEAAVAGALSVQLGGNSSYFGKIVEKPTMGDAHRELEPEDIRRTNRLMFVASGLFAVILLAIRFLIVGV